MMPAPIGYTSGGPQNPAGRLVEGVEADMIAREKAKAEKLRAARDILAQAFPAGRTRT